MNKIFCLIGKSASGKSTIEKSLCERGLKRIISTTSRPIRENEVDGVDYHYVTREEFEDKLNGNEFIESVTYNDWMYGVEKEKVDLQNNNYVIVVEPHGFRQFQLYFGKEQVVPIYIYTDNKERLLRSLNREINPDCKEICRRFISDIELFKEIDEDENILKVKNLELYQATTTIYNYITDMLNK